MNWRRLGGLGPWWLVAAIAAAGLWLSMLGRIRLGGHILAAAIVLAAVLRVMLPSPRGGGLEVRSRRVDVILLALLAAGVLLAFNLVKLSPS
ncbi:MAG: DUF3017 domain-containing protein [Lapillicoccus sp.]